jgi:endothelin-converting enzyme/putative endopeptidase
LELELIIKTPEESKLNATTILALEIGMSKPCLVRLERRDGRLQHKPMNIADLQKMTPAINWNSYFTEIDFTKLDTVIVAQPKYMSALQTILSENNVSAWNEYMKWNFINGSTPLLSTEIDEANFDFYGKTLTGALKQGPCEEKALQTVNGTVGEALVKLYVEKMFPAETKTKAEKLIDNIINAYQNRISNLNWMFAGTKTKAIEKLNKITIKIGYPDKWIDYLKLEIKGVAEGRSYYENVKSIARCSFQNDIDKLNKPVDRTEWYISPQTVNAYYTPSY